MCIRDRFKPNQKMAAVYDWIGSLQLIPLYFSLSSTPGNMIDPSLSIDYSADKVLFMEQRDDPIPLSADDDEVSFKGFGEIGEIGMTPPSRTWHGILIPMKKDVQRKSVVRDIVK